MIWPMARSQIMTSKKPIIGAQYLIPLEMKITRIVPRLTSQMRAKNIRIGRIT
jgi:hypothetical protein